METNFLASVQWRRLRVVRTGELNGAPRLTRDQERELFRRLALVAVLAVVLTSAAGTAFANVTRDVTEICREAQRLAVAGEYEAAVARYDEAIALAPQHAEAFLGRGNALRSLPGRHHDAIRDFDRALALDPRLEEALYARALEWMMLGEKQQTIADCSRLLGLNPARLDALYLRANMYDVLDFPDSALADYSRALAVAPEAERGNARMLRADFQRQRGLYEAAVTDYDAVLAADPRFPARLGRAESLRELGRHEAAVADYNACLAERPEDAEARYGRALSNLRLQRNAEAIADFDSFLVASPDAPLALNGRGMARFQLGRDREAIADFDAAIGSDPHLGGAYLNRIWASFFAGGANSSGVFAHEERFSPESGWAPYLGIAAHFRSLRAGAPERAAAALAWAGRSADGSWPDPILQFLAGEIPEAALLDAATDTDRQTEVRACLGLSHALANRREAALAHLRWVAGNGNREFLETSVARRALAWLEGNR